MANHVDILSGMKVYVKFCLGFIDYIIYIYKMYCLEIFVYVVIYTIGTVLNLTKQTVLGGSSWDL